MTQNQSHTAPISAIQETASRKSIFTIGFMMLLLFAFLRPLTLTFVDVEVFGLSAFEIFGIVSSYMLLIPVLLNFRNLRLDRMTLLSMFFCLYCAVSITWGSNVAIFARVVLPFILFYAARIFITEPKQIGTILIAMVMGYVIPITKSTYEIISERSIEFVNYWTGMTRFEGAFGGSHSLAYAMLFFSFIYCLVNRSRLFTGKLSRFGVLILQLLAIFCLYKSYTRTALAGFIIFWSIYLWGANKKRFYFLIIACVLIAVMNYQKIQVIFWQFGQHGQTELDLNAASSGRFTLWLHNIQIFLDSAIPHQILGRGLGIEGKHGVRVVGSKTDVWAPHNNYLNLLMSLGVFGLCIYLALLASLFWDICTCGLDKSGKYLFVGILISVAVMNFLSNAVIFRVELSQYFWLFMGFFYLEKEMSKGGPI